MAINQLFKIKPGITIIKEILENIDIDMDNIEQKNDFTVKELEEINIRSILPSLTQKLDKFYLPCKKKYLNNLNIKKFITILRQLLKLYNYKIISVGSYDKGNKFITYNIIQINTIKNKKDINCIISFDQNLF